MILLQNDYALTKLNKNMIGNDNHETHHKPAVCYSPWHNQPIIEHDTNTISVVCLHMANSTFSR